jgi:hypothetical protein
LQDPATGQVLVFTEALENLTGSYPHRLVMGQKVTNHNVLAELDDRGNSRLADQGDGEGVQGGPIQVPTPFDGSS